MPFSPDNSTYRSGKWRRPVALLLLGVAILLSLHVAHNYAAMMAAQTRLQRQRQPPPRPPSAALLTGSLTRVSIPKISLEVVVEEASSRSSLLNAPGHLDDTRVPGQAGNSGLAGHRGPFFRNLGDLGRGDDIFVRRAGHRYHYVVKRKAIVEANDATVVKPSPQNRLTLITYYPPHYSGPAPQRLVVIAERIDDAVPN